VSEGMDGWMDDCCGVLLVNLLQVENELEFRISTTGCKKIYTKPHITFHAHSLMLSTALHATFVSRIRGISLQRGTPRGGEAALILGQNLQRKKTALGLNRKFLVRLTTFWATAPSDASYPYGNSVAISRHCRAANDIFSPSALSDVFLSPKKLLLSLMRRSLCKRKSLGHPRHSANAYMQAKLSCLNIVARYALVVTSWRVGSNFTLPSSQTSLVKPVLAVRLGKSQTPQLKTLLYVS
jgi:hypothetical protein